MRRRVLSLVLGLALVAAGCGSVTPGRPRVTVSPGFPNVTMDPDLALPLPPASQVVFRAQASGGLVAPQTFLRGRPFVTVYGDGTAFVLSRAGNRSSSSDRPVQLLRGSIAEATLRTLVRRAMASGLFGSKRPDLGDPMVTDMPSTAVSFRPDRAPARTVSAYALSWTGGDDQVKPGARYARRALRGLLDALNDAVSGARPWTPDRVDVREPDRGEVGGSGDVAPWPGPALSGVLHPTPTGGCGVLSGAAARRVWTAALTVDTARWRDPAGVHVLVLRGLLPGEAGCR